MAPKSAVQAREEVGHGAAVPRRRLSENLSGYLFLSPWFIGMLVIVIGPMAASLYLSFTNYNPLAAPEWIGLENYRTMFGGDSRFLTSVRVTTVYVLLSVPLQLVFALLLALVLDRGLRALSFYRSIYYLPSLLGGSVAIALLWRQVFGSNGLVNQVLKWFDITGPSWIANPDTAIYTLVALSVWMFGAPMIIFLAGLRQIPAMYYEAAAVDGAGPVRRFFTITIPLLTPVIFFNLILQTINAFQAFTPAYVISDGTGGPVDSTLFYTLYLYQEGFTSFRMGYASAMAWVLLVVVALFTAINFLASKFWVFYGDEG